MQEGAKAHEQVWRASSGGGSDRHASHRDRIRGHGLRLVMEELPFPTKRAQLRSLSSSAG